MCSINVEAAKKRKVGAVTKCIVPFCDGGQFCSVMALTCELIVLCCRIVVE